MSNNMSTLMYHTHRLTAPRGNQSAAGSANVGQLTDSLPTSHQCVWTYRGQEGVVSMHVCAHRIKNITGPESLRGSTWIQIFFQLQSSFTAADFSWEGLGYLILTQPKNYTNTNQKKRRVGFMNLE